MSLRGVLERQTPRHLITACCWRNTFFKKYSCIDASRHAANTVLNLVRTPRRLYVHRPFWTDLLRAQLKQRAAMVAEVGGICYFDIPSPNTTVFSVLWPPSIALWGSLVPPYSLVVLLEAFTDT